jgi:hypothetical protein
MPVLDSIKGHLTPEIKATVTGSPMNIDLVVNLGGDLTISSVTI